MRLTHLGHAAVLVETDAARVLIDPGNYSDAWRGLTDLDAVVVTHRHPDHVDPENVPGLLTANPTAACWVEPGVLAAVALGEGRGEAFGAEDVRTVGDLTLTGIGGRHAIIHADIPRIGNTGVLLAERGGPTFFHPGDMVECAPPGVDVLAVPLYGPWAASKETVDFVRAVGAEQGFGIHDALLSERGVTLLRSQLGSLTSITLHDLRDGTPYPV